MLGMLLGKGDQEKKQGVAISRNSLFSLVAGVRFELTTFGL
jgi:hypothetical protein